MNNLNLELLIGKGGVIQKFYEDFYERKRNYVEKTGVSLFLNFREYGGNFIRWTCGEEVNDFQAQATTNKNGFSRRGKRLQPTEVTPSLVDNLLQFFRCFYNA